MSSLFLENGIFYFDVLPILQQEPHLLQRRSQRDKMGTDALSPARVDERLTRHIQRWEQGFENGLGSQA